MVRIHRTMCVSLVLRGLSHSFTCGAGVYTYVLLSREGFLKVDADAFGSSVVFGSGDSRVDRRTGVLLGADHGGDARPVG